MQSQIDFAKACNQFPPVDSYEEWVLDAMTGMDSDKSLGALTVICADLLEMVRRADPAYGLKAAETATFEPDGEALPKPEPVDLNHDYRGAESNG